MGLEVSIYSYDYEQARKIVNKMLDNISCSCLKCSDGKDNIQNLPSADDIIDAIWDAIK